MKWTLFVLGAVLSWGIYGPMLHRGQVLLLAQVAKNMGVIV